MGTELEVPAAGVAALTVSPNPAGWGSVLRIEGISVAPSESPPTVVLERDGESIPLGSVAGEAGIAVRTPATGTDGAYDLVVKSASGVARLPLALSAQAPAAALLATMLVSPNPATWGQDLVLSGVGFGPPTGRVSIFDAAHNTTTLSVSAWSPIEVIAGLPAVAPAGGDGNYLVVAQPATGPAMQATVAVKTALATPPGTPFVPTLPALSSDPLLLLDPMASADRNLLAAAGKAAAKWRYEYLRAEATAAAQRVTAYEADVLSLMQLTLAKVASAEQLLNPALIAAVQALQNDTQTLGSLAESQDLTDIVNDVADKVTSLLLLAAVIEWLTTHDVIDFWVGLFDALIDDIAAFDSGGSRTKRYLDKAFNLLDIKDLVQGLLNSLDDEINAFVAPLRRAVAEVIGGTDQAMAEVFSNFDLPLTEQAPAAAGTADVADVNPLGAVENKLNDALESLIEKIRSAIDTIFDLAHLDNLRKKFRDLMFDFLVLPILAILAVGVAAGPFGAAIIAAIVCIALIELLHLVLGWLTGPLLGEIDKLKKKVLDAVGRLQQLLGREAGLIGATDPSYVLQIVSGELRELKDVLPREYLDAVADLLAQARDTILRDALALAHGAEQALGLENATAFDAIGFDYRTGLPLAAQLPGGSDPSFLSGAALVRDLGQLERQRVGDTDGKNLQITHRLSIQALLGDPGRFLEFLHTGRLSLDLTTQNLVDIHYPGVYRALIKEIRVAGVFPPGTAGLTPNAGIPVTITHLGESRTRIKEGANPSAPPIALPSCLPGTQDSFLQQLLGTVPPGPARPILHPIAVARGGVS